MRARYQGGSLAGFLIIGAMLALVLVGGLYGLNRYNAERASSQLAEQAAKDTEAEKKAETPKEANKNDPKAAEKQNDKPAANEKPAETTTPNDAKPAPAPAPAPTPSPAVSTPKPSSQLPQTGPIDTLYALVVFAALAYASAHYLRSRKQA